MADSYLAISGNMNQAHCNPEFWLRRRLAYYSGCEPSQ